MTKYLCFLILFCLCLLINSCQGSQKKDNDESLDSVFSVIEQAECDIDTIDVLSDREKERIICQKLRQWLLGNGEVTFSKQAEKALYESTWPESGCDIDGTLFNPDEGRDLRVYKLPNGCYKYSVVCPFGCNQRFEDYADMKVHLNDKQEIIIDDIIWNGNESEKDDNVYNEEPSIYDAIAPYVGTWTKLSTIEIPTAVGPTYETHEYAVRINNDATGVEVQSKVMGMMSQEYSRINFNVTSVEGDNVRFVYENGIPGKINMKEMNRH